jgi:hypothetical protein
MTVQQIIDSVTEQDSYRRDAEIKRRIYDWAVSKLPPCDPAFTRTITGVDYETGVATYTDRANVEIEAEQYAADLMANAPRYVLENQYIILCDVLRQALGQAATRGKLSFEELPTMMMMLKAGSKDTYEKLRDAMDMINSALIRYDVKWWDSAVWHPQPELTEASAKILELAQ